jgi:hypothetical protein
MEETKGGPAFFPVSLRDYVATAAMEALIVKFPSQFGVMNPDGTDSNETERLNNIRRVVSKSAYLYADAMLEARTRQCTSLT